MRIVAGKYRSRILKAPKSDAIRPTSDKLRGAIFNMLRSRRVLDGARVMDVFCGTGALGIEALSQGAADCVFVDNAKASLELAKENAATLKISDEAVFVFRDAAKMGARPENIPERTLVFLDPPYKKNLIVPTLEALKNGGWLAAGAMLVIETEEDFAAALPGWLNVLDQRVHGAAKLTLANIDGSNT